MFPNGKGGSLSEAAPRFFSRLEPASERRAGADLDDAAARIADPRHKLEKTYWAQVEGDPTDADLQALRQGIRLSDFTAQPAKVRLIDPPHGLWERDPPIRFRQSIPTRWLEIRIREGKNRQVRRMTAAIGYPTLRLIRAGIGALRLDGLALGEWRELAGGLDALEGKKHA